MDYGNMIGDSFEYAKEAVIGKWTKWLMLIIATILLALPLMGYTLKVLRGEKPAPEVKDWGTLFIDGIKYLIVALIYALPIIILCFLIIGTAMVGAMAGGDFTAMAAVAGTVIAGLFIIVVVAIIICLFEMIGIVRLARTGSIGEAFNFSAILATIGKIGWGPYIFAIIIYFIVAVIYSIIIGIIQIIPVLGFIITFCLIAPWALFTARYFCQVYDSAGA